MTPTPATGSSQDSFDLIVIGGGPAGYVAAIRAAQLGLKAVCIEKRKTLGGTCLNVGCIPSKALLESTEHFHNAKHKFQKHGILTGELKVDLAVMMKRKDAVVRQLTNGIAGLFKKHKIEFAVGEGSFAGRNGDQTLVKVKGESGDRTLSAPRVLIASGSEPAALPFLAFDEKRILSSTGALEIPEIPKHLVVIGGGVIGLELGSVWARLGAKVTVLEFQDHILGATDRQMANETQKILAKQGLEFRLQTKCVGATRKGDWVLLEAEDMKAQAKFTLEADYVLVCTGRRPFTGGLNLPAVGLSTDKAGRIPIDKHYATQVPGIWAVGDVVEGPMLAHKAEEEGIAAVELMAGQKGHVNYEAIPGVVYTWPELATVGASEEDLKAKGVAYKVGTFPYLANGRAKAMEETDGLVKIISDAKTDRVLGVHILGARAAEMIHEATTIIEFGGSAEDIARTPHAHPTLSEVVKEAALAVDKRQIHL